MTLSDLLFSGIVFSFRDLGSSAAVDGCEFAESKQRVEFTVANIKGFVSIRDWNLFVLEKQQWSLGCFRQH